ncbi:MAG: hypothetical protein KBE85_04325 [Bacteroides sp.]|nr:hypothetical protein [Bacteroides sp.]
MMKQIMKYVGFLFLLCIVVTSCNNAKNKQEAKLVEIIPIFSKEDTAEVVRLTTEYLEHLKNKEFDLALQMLNQMKNDSVQTLSKKDQEDMKQQYRTFPVLSYTIEGIMMNDERNTEVTYSVEFFKKQAGQEDIPNTMSFCLNPQKIQGTWYLGVLNR